MPRSDTSAGSTCSSTTPASARPVTSWTPTPRSSARSSRRTSSALTETTRVFLPLLKQGVTPAIVNISSVVGKRAWPARSYYSSSKFAVAGFSESIRAELAKDGIDVIVVSPGLTQTNFSKNMLEQKAKLQLDHLRGMSSEDVASRGATGRSNGAART